MLNNPVSQQLPITSMQMGQLEPIVNKADSSGRDRQMGLLHPISSDSMSQEQATLNDHVRLMRAMPGNPRPQGLSMPNMQSGRVESHVSNTSMRQLYVPNKQAMQMETILNSMGPQKLSITPKRKAPMEPLSSRSVTSNKRLAQIEHRPWLQQVSNISNKRSLHTQQLSNAPRLQHTPSSSKKKTLMESTSSKAGMPRSVNSKNQNAQVQQSSKVQTESSESVRSKMRESLAAALALVSQLDKPMVPNSNASNEVVNAQGKLENSSQCAGSAPATTDTAQFQSLEIVQSVDSSSAATDSGEHATAEHGKTLTSNEGFSEECKDSEVGSTNISTNENMLDSIQVSNFDKQDFQSNFTFSTDDVPFSDNFFVKDELLQGNDLSWVLDPDMAEMASRKESLTNEEQRLEPEEISGGCKEQEVCSTELLASRIEAELFKLFGGVNKKYKEKGRSLLFNLKDRNNPELRERVMSGEIPPGRLCSMTAEELASKELSQWRIAKAEELAQMVVLPSDADIRRLVKKTHKGEVQVEVEHEDNLSVEVSGGATSVPRSQTKRKDMEAPSSTPGGTRGDVKNGEKSSIEKDNPVALTIPSNDGADPMQGLMADDALRDADFLPPIVSLDEFMESLHSELPFENLSVESGKVTPDSEKSDSEVGSELKSSDLTPSDHVNSTHDKSEKVHNTCPNVDADHDKRANAESGVIPSDARCSESHPDRKPSDGIFEVRSTDGIKPPSSHVELIASQCHAEEKYGGSHMHPKTAVQSSISKGECIWEGMLQLNISTNHSVISIFKSGQKTSVKDWPGFLEIKGRVRLDAFEKFLQELPMSRTRAIMVSHFVSKEESTNNEQSILREVADSYILDERVGYAEPVHRVELYFCPPHKKTVEMLSKILPKEQIEAVNAIDYGLIGIIVWRKNQLTSTISPHSSSHHKHSSKRQYFSRVQQDINMNANLTSKAGSPMGSTSTETGTPTDDDDIPPGFGPAMARDEYDLPEFEFSGGSNPTRLVRKPYTGPCMVPLHSVNQNKLRPAEQMRELVHKYGQTKEIASSGNWQDKFGVTFQPWNDDDDDIPEWQPQTHQNQFPSQQPMQNFQLRPHMLNQSHTASHHQSIYIESPQPPSNVTQGQRNLGPPWVPPTQGKSLQSSGMQHYGAPEQSTAWRQNVPRTRGF